MTTNDNPMKFDRDMARRFIEVLTGGRHNAVTWQYFPDNKNQSTYSKKLLSGHPHGDLRTHYRALEKKQTEGCGIFVMVNAGDGKGRKASNVVAVRALFVDLDGSPMEPALQQLTPHIVVESSPGRYHLYWKVGDCPRERFSSLQRAIAAKLSGDAACVDLCRVLRVPGYWHLKGVPYMTKLLEVNQIPTYTVDEVVTGLGLESTDAVLNERINCLPSATLQQTLSIAQADTHEICSTDVIIPETGEVIDLKKWAACNRDFDLLTALKQHAPQVLRGELSGGKQHIQCPFESEHTEQIADHSTFAANKGNGHNSWEIHCMHAHCFNRDRLHYLKAMFDKRWLPVGLLANSGPVERKRPPKIYMPHIDLATDMAWSGLRPDEFRIALHLFYLSCQDGSGTLPDDNWLLARKLGIEETCWREYRGTFVRVGWLNEDGFRIWNPLIVREVKAASSAYNSKIAAGKSRHCKHKPTSEVP